MMRLLLTFGMVLVMSWTCVAQTSTDDSPATKADVERYFQVVRSHDMMKKLMGSMTQSMHQMVHEQYLKHQDELPADYESKMTAMMDDMFANMPMDEMMQAMVPAYQKHFTKGDMDNLVAFYSTPTGEKVLHELPAIMAESMQDMMPIMTKYMDTVKQTLLKKTEVMIAESKKASDATTPAARN
ncbi:MAG TPA: DUF2059 domain-containing protein [Terriglobales bacterium]